MAFTFLHTADWQIGKTFGGFDVGKASVLRHARMEAIDRLAAAARSAGAVHVVVCGDVFDSPGLSDFNLREVAARLATHADITWHLLPGNHDPARPDGVWPRLARLGLAGNVRLLLEAAPVEVSPSVYLLPAPLAAKSVSHDPTAWMDEAATPPGSIRIGVGHGSAQGFGSSGTASVGIDPRRRMSAHLDYLALGDWHGVREVADGVWYAGTPEPDQFPDNEPGFALAVTIAAAGARPDVRRIAVGRHAWLKRVADVRGVEDMAPIEAELAALGAAKSSVLVELTLTGAVSPAVDAQVAARLDALAASIFHLEVRRSALTLTSGADDRAAIADPQLARVLDRLEAMRRAGNQPEVVEGALRRFFALLRQTEGMTS